ncbi:hypothetical protein LY76DRAFT_593196 [Colletotrichum caudatum]|nr:hypothetical protein LY76DRAFT_593196 [Colletotrichum caudatum]
MGFRRGGRAVSVESVKSGVHQAMSSQTFGEKAYDPRPIDRLKRQTNGSWKKQQRLRWLAVGIGRRGFDLDLREMGERGKGPEG